MLAVINNSICLEKLFKEYNKFIYKELDLTDRNQRAFNEL